MIIDNGYFINEIFLPQAKPDASYGVLEVESSLSFFIAKYEKDCLNKVLGPKLYREFVSNLDYSEDSKIKPGSDQKWDDLLNGKEYTDVNGEDKVWEGMRSKVIENGSYNSSFIANYIYCLYEKSDDDTRANTGNTKENAKNAFLVDKTPKIVRAWNEFVGKVGITTVTNNYFYHKGSLCVDWRSTSFEVTLDDFIKDSNDLVADTYANYNPMPFNTINQFGL